MYHRSFGALRQHHRCQAAQRLLAAYLAPSMVPRAARRRAANRLLRRMPATPLPSHHPPALNTEDCRPERM